MSSDTTFAYVSFGDFLPNGRTKQSPKKQQKTKHQDEKMQKKLEHQEQQKIQNEEEAQ